MGEVQGMGPDPKSIIPVANLSTYSVFGEGSSHRVFMVYTEKVYAAYSLALLGPMVRGRVQGQSPCPQTSGKVILPPHMQSD